MASVSNIKQKADAARLKLIPKKSADRYTYEYENFNFWRQANGTNMEVNEDIILTYVSELIQMSENICKSPKDKCQVEFVTSNFSLHKFDDTISDRKIVYQVLKMVDSVLIFINDKNNMQLVSLFLSMISPYDSQPISTRLLGDFMEFTSNGIASRLSKKLKKTVYVSYNLEEDRVLSPLIEKRLFEEIQENANMF